MYEFQDDEFREIVSNSLDNPRIEGFYQDSEGRWLLDLRYTVDYVASSAILTPRTADLNIVGPYILAIPDEIAAQMGLNK